MDTFFKDLHHLGTPKNLVENEIRERERGGGGGGGLWGSFPVCLLFSLECRFAYKC